MKKSRRRRVFPRKRSSARKRSAACEFRRARRARRNGRSWTPADPRTSISHRGVSESTGLWEGVTTRELVQIAGGVLPEARFVLVHGLDRGWTTSLTLESLIAKDSEQSRDCQGAPVADHQTVLAKARTKPPPPGVSHDTARRTRRPAEPAPDGRPIGSHPTWPPPAWRRARTHRLPGPP